MSETVRSDGASQETFGVPDQKTAPKGNGMFAISVIATVAGMSLLLLLRKPPEAEKRNLHAGDKKITASAENLRDDAYLQKHFSIERENGEPIPFCFLEDGFTINIQDNAFTMDSMNVCGLHFSLDQMRYQVKPNGITDIQHGEEFHFASDENTLHIPQADMEKIICALCDHPTDQPVCSIDDVTFRLHVSNSYYRMIVPETGTLSVAFQRTLPPKSSQMLATTKRHTSTLTAQSK